MLISIVGLGSLSTLLVVNVNILILYTVFGLGKLTRNDFIYLAAVWVSTLPFSSMIILKFLINLNVGRIGRDHETTIFVHLVTAFTLIGGVGSAKKYSYY